MRRGRLIAGAALIAASLVFLALALTEDRRLSPRVEGSLDVTLQTREYVMSGVYKVYALKDRPAGIWVAKAIFENRTGAPIENLRVRYRMAEFSDWGSWQVHRRMVPDQTVVDTYYPILSDRCGKQENRATTELTMEYEYTDALGRKHTDSMTRRMTMLGVREVVYRTLPLEELHGEFQEFFANSPLTAAWVTPDDKAAGGLAALANERALGAGASINDENCIQVMRECYDIMRAINITYQSPGGGGSSFGDKSFDPFLVQTIQYPRDTIRKRSGTCIELAVLYASMLKSVGIKPYLVMLPGHCFPIGQLPVSGAMIPVESTGVGGGALHSVDFQQAVDIGQKQWNELLQTGQFMLVDIDQCIEMGIVPPDLEPLPDDILQRWKIADMLATEPRVAHPPPPDAGRTVPVDAGTRQPPMAMQPGPWRALIANQNPATVKVDVRGNQVQLVFTLQYTIVDYSGAARQCEEVNQFEGTVEGNILTAVCRNAVWRMDGQPVQPNLPIQLRMQIAPDGRSAQGIVAGNTGQAQIAMQWQN